MNFEALRRRVERAETRVQDRAGETGQQVDALKRAWREGWTPGRIIIAGLAGGFLAGRMEPSAKLTASLRGSLTGARWLQMIGTVSNLVAAAQASAASEEARRAADNADVAASEATQAAGSTGPAAYAAGTAAAATAGAAGAATPQAVPTPLRPATSADTQPRPAEAATELSEN